MAVLAVVKAVDRDRGFISSANIRRLAELNELKAVRLGGGLRSSSASFCICERADMFLLHRIFQRLTFLLLLFFRGFITDHPDVNLPVCKTDCREFRLCLSSRNVQQ